MLLTDVHWNVITLDIFPKPLRFLLAEVDSIFGLDRRWLSITDLCGHIWNLAVIVCQWWPPGWFSSPQHHFWWSVTTQNTAWVSNTKRREFLTQWRYSMMTEEIQHRWLYRLPVGTLLTFNMFIQSSSGQLSAIYILTKWGKFKIVTFPLSSLCMFSSQDNFYQIQKGCHQTSFCNLCCLTWQICILK